ncbi:MAG: hypothetical protein ACK5LO_02515 [Leucobacter sp.]
MSTSIPDQFDVVVDVAHRDRALDLAARVIATPEATVERAEAYYAFLTAGQDDNGATDEAAQESEDEEHDDVLPQVFGLLFGGAR